MADNIFSVILEKVGNQPLKTTKVLCEVLGLGLAAAKGMVDKAPIAVATEIDGDKAITLRNKLEAIGNTVSIPGMETNSATPAKTQKGAEPKKTTTKKSAPSPLNVATPSNDEFDTIFGGKKKATAPTKSKNNAKSTPKVVEEKVSAAPNDEFDAIFGKGK